jgi:hypothetical protein
MEISSEQLNGLTRTLDKIGPKSRAAHLDVFFFQGLNDPEKHKEREQQLLRAKPILDLIKDHIQKEYNALSRVKSNDYALSDWAARQAHRNGQQEILEKLWKLFP